MGLEDFFDGRRGLGAIGLGKASRVFVDAGIGQRPDLSCSALRPAPVVALFSGLAAFPCRASSFVTTFKIYADSAKGACGWAVGAFVGRYRVFVGAFGTQAAW